MTPLNALLGEIDEDHASLLYLRRLELLRREKLHLSDTRGHAIYKHSVVLDCAGAWLLRGNTMRAACALCATCAA